MENMYVYKTESCLKRFLAYDNKGAGFLLNRIHVFNSSNSDISVFTASRTDIYASHNPNNNYDQKKEIDFGDISRRVKLNLTKKGHFVIKTNKKDSWEDRPQYELYLDNAILKGDFERIESEEALCTKQRDVFYFKVNGQRYHLQSSYTTVDKPLDVLKEHQVKKLQYAIDKINGANTKEELNEFLERYCKNFYIKDCELYKEVQ